MLGRVKELEKSEVWMLLANQGTVKETLRSLNLPLFDEQLPIIQRSNTLSLTMDSVGNSKRFELSLECANDVDGAKLQEFATNSWMLLLNLAKGWLSDPMYNDLFSDLQESFSAKVQNRTTVGSVQVRETSLNQVLQGVAPPPRVR
jgi:hypothetical protein